MKIIHIESLGWCVLKEENGDLAYSPLDKEKAYSVKDKTFKARSIKVNASLHLYCSKVAKALNDGGFTVQKFLRRKSEKRIEKVFSTLLQDLGLSVSQDIVQKIKNAKTEILENKDLELDWKMQLVKDIIWRNIQLALFEDKTSTTQLSSGEVTQVYKTMDKYLSSLGIESIDFPSEQSMIFEQNHKGL